MQRFLYILLFLAMPALSGTLAGGTAHSLAIDSANGGRVYAWGDNSYGQLGDGTNNSAMYAIEVFGLSNVVSVAAGDGFSLALDSSGYVWAWGRNDLGQVGDTTTTARNTPVRVSRLSNVIHISAGKDFVLVAKGDGTVWGWGSNATRQLGQIPGNGTQMFLAPVQISGLASISMVAAGTDFSLALTTTGGVLSWGANTHGQLGIGNTTDNHLPQQVLLASDVKISEIAARNHAIARQDNGKVWGWGINDKGQVGDDTTTQRTTPAQVVDITNVKEIAIADTWSLARCGDGTVWTWGDNTEGQLLDKTKTERHYPVKAATLSDIVAIGAGATFAIVRKHAGDVLAWGGNSGGQLGSGSTSDKFGEAAAVLKAAETSLILSETSSSTPVAGGTASGTSASLTLSATVSPTSSDLGRTGFPLIWAEVPGFDKIFLTVFGWIVSKTPVPYSGLATLKKTEIPVLSNFNAAAFPGAAVFAGYGFNSTDAIDTGRTAKIYTVP